MFPHLVNDKRWYCLCTVQAGGVQYAPVTGVENPAVRQYNSQAPVWNRDNSLLWVEVTHSWEGLSDVIMCSVVEIKNREEYCITYHSPESLETLSSPAPSLEYQHLFKVSSKSNEESLYNSQTENSLRSVECDAKDFSLEEITRIQTREPKEKPENSLAADLENTQPREEVCDDDDDNLDNSSNNEQNGGKWSDRELKGL